MTISIGGDTDDIDKVEWDLDGNGTYDPPTSTFSTVTSFATSGPRTLRVRVTDSKGRSAVGRGEVSVSPASGNLVPYVQINAVSPRVNQPVNLSGYGDDSDGTIASYAWDTDADGEFDDGTTSFITATFPTLGDQVVALRVTDNQGATFDPVSDRHDTR